VPDAHSGENARSVLAKLAYRFINYGATLPSSSCLCLFLFVCARRESTVRDSFPILGTSRAAATAAAAAAAAANRTALLFLLSSCEHKSLFAPCALARRLFSARRLCTRACTQLGCYRARVSSRVIMLNERKVTGNVPSSLLAFVREQRGGAESRDTKTERERESRARFRVASSQLFASMIDIFPAIRLDLRRPCRRVVDSPHARLRFIRSIAASLRIVRRPRAQTSRRSSIFSVGQFSNNLFPFLFQVSTQRPIPG